MLALMNKRSGQILFLPKFIRALRPIHTRGFAPGACSGIIFARVSTHEGAFFAPGACSQAFNRLNIVEHFAG